MSPHSAKEEEPSSLRHTGWSDAVRDHRPIRTFTPRARISDLTRRRVESLLPRYQVRDLPLDPQAAFGRRAPLVLEIGSGHGAAAIGYAQAHPDHDVLAADIHLPGVVRMLAAAEDSGVTNLRVYVRDALDLLGGGLAPHTVSAVHLLFPDPWPKAKHAKRRLVQQPTLAAIRAVLAPGGHLIVGTDHPVYARWTIAQLSEFASAEVERIERPAWKGDDGFEGKGVRAGRPPTYLRVGFP